MYELDNILSHKECIARDNYFNNLRFKFAEFFKVLQKEKET